MKAPLLRIVFINPTHSSNMGYITNCLTRELADMGHEVHLLTSTLNVMGNKEYYQKTYAQFLGDAYVPEGIYLEENFTVHRMPALIYKKEEVYFRGVYTKLKVLKPDIVHIYDVNHFLFIQAVFAKVVLRFKLFTAYHGVLSVFPLHNLWSNTSIYFKLKWTILHKITGYIGSLFTEQCYPATEDGQLIVTKYYGWPFKKCKVTPLGVNTARFYPLKDIAAKKKLRQEIFTEIHENDFLCIYTGKYTNDKNPLCLAHAVNSLADKYPNIKAIFIGDGPQSQSIAVCKNCYMISFVQNHELAKYYQASDVGVWPKEESLSMIDATACGLPIIVSDKMLSTERVEGNGLVYFENQADDLALKILVLYKDEALAKKYSEHGSKKIIENYSYKKIAKERVSDYYKSLGIN